MCPAFVLGCRAVTGSYATSASGAWLHANCTVIVPEKAIVLCKYLHSFLYIYRKLFHRSVVRKIASDSQTNWPLGGKLKDSGILSPPNSVPLAGSL